ncbi:sprT-like domain-containing protein Spartan [Aplysia californica]|uniref:Protein with SprT-like domain at the N terminus n=1 Tax=Aplysia californica TaxID=6500 RepID=A0ABM0ZVB4_APLCA|nr:sprT-like domain-containing protein Spartan [Aplysia californica]
MMTASDQNFDDFDFAKRLQEEYDREAAAHLDSNEITSDINTRDHNGDKKIAISSRPLDLNGMSPVDPSLEISDPNPDIRELFLQFNEQFFWGRLSGIEVKWSPRMTLCAGLCVYEGRGGLCSVRLSLPLLKLRPRKDLVETLLHEMIHAFLFVTDNNRDHDGHGPQFQGHMKRINKATGASISIYHTFHDEVASYQQHWWRCDGPCRKRPPYFGYVKRAMNRAPSFRDFWWAEHQASCGGSYTKIKEPEGYGQKKSTKGKGKDDHSDGASKDIRSFLGKGKTLGSSGANSSRNSSASSKPATNGKHTSSSGKNPSSLFSSVVSGSSKTNVPDEKGKKYVLVNGVLVKRNDLRDSSHPAVQNKPHTAGTNASSSYSSSSSKSTANGQMNGGCSTSSKSSNGAHSEDWPDDEDDLWVFDIDASEPVPKTSTKPPPPVSQKKGSESFIDLTKSEFPHRLGKKHSKDGGKNWKGHSGVRKFVSVCEDKSKETQFFTKKKPRIKKHYILDDLDSNEGLWEGGYSPNKIKKEIGEAGNRRNLKSSSPHHVSKRSDDERNRSKDKSLSRSSKFVDKNESKSGLSFEERRRDNESRDERKHDISAKTSSMFPRETKVKTESVKKEDDFEDYTGTSSSKFHNWKSSDSSENNLVSQKSFVDSKSSFSGQGFVLGSASEGQSYLSQIRRTFVRGHGSSSAGPSSAGRLKTSDGSIYAQSSFSSHSNQDSESSVLTSGSKRKSDEAFGPGESDSTGGEFLSGGAEAKRRSNVSVDARPSGTTTENSRPGQTGSGGNREGGAGPRLVSCPVCCAEVPENVINVHLDDCLES